MKAEAIAQALDGRKPGGDWMARCPADDDRKPSLPSPNLTIPETCTYLKLGRTCVHGLISDGVLETIKIGERRLVKLKSARKLAENGTE